MNSFQKAARLIIYLAWPLVLSGLAGAAVIAADTVVITEVQGTKTTGQLSSWTDKKLSLQTDREQEFDLADVRSVSVDQPPRKADRPAFLIFLANGDRIYAQSVTASNDMLSVSWPLLGREKAPDIPLEKIGAMVLELPQTPGEQLRLFADLDTLAPGADVVLLGNGDRSLGEFQKLDAAFVELKSPASLLKIGRSRVRAIRMNPELTSAKRPSGRRVLLTLIDDSRLTATDLRWVDGRLKFKSVALGELSLPLSSITACQIFGESIIPISDYAAAKVEFTPYLSATWTLAVNANVLRGPLTLRGIEYATGLGMHSRMAVTYELHGNESAFRSLVGIDDAAKGAGSAVFSIEVDGRKAWTSGDLTGQSPVAEVPEVNLRGARRLTLIVDFGQFADVSDYADWCDAVVIVDRPR